MTTSYLLKSQMDKIGRYFEWDILIMSKLNGHVWTNRLTFTNPFKLAINVLY